MAEILNGLFYVLFIVCHQREIRPLSSKILQNHIHLVNSLGQTAENLNIWIHISSEMTTVLSLNLYLILLLIFPYIDIMSLYDILMFYAPNFENMFLYIHLVYLKAYIQNLIQNGPVVS